MSDEVRAAVERVVSEMSNVLSWKSAGSDVEAVFITPCLINWRNELQSALDAEHNSPIKEPSE